MTELILVRHGQSLGNLHRSFLGHTDIDLTDLGKKQAEKTANALKDWCPNRIYSSDLIRAYHTAEPIAANWGLDVIPHAGLREIFAGDWEGKTFDELEKTYRKTYREFRENMGVACPDGGESTWEVRKRVKKTVDELVAAHPDERLILVTHATAICMFCCEILGIPKEESWRLKLPSNASITSLIYHNGKYMLLSYGETNHLGDVRTLRPPLN